MRDDIRSSSRCRPGRSRRRWRPAESCPTTARPRLQLITHTRDERRWESRFSRGNRGYSAVMGTEFTATPRGWDQLHGSTAGTGTKLVHGNTVGAGRFLVPVQLSSAVHRRIRRIAFRFPVLGSQPTGDVSHIPGGRLPSLSARPAVIPATLKRAATNFVAW